MNVVPAWRGVIEADDRKSALRLLGQRGLFPSNLELNFGNGAAAGAVSKIKPAQSADVSFGNCIKRKDITALTREISALLGAAIPIPQTLDSLGEEEENPALKAVVLDIADSVRKARRFPSRIHAVGFGGLATLAVPLGNLPPESSPR